MCPVITDREGNEYVAPVVDVEYRLKKGEGKIASIYLTEIPFINGSMEEVQTVFERMYAFYCANPDNGINLFRAIQKLPEESQHNLRLDGGEIDRVDFSKEDWLAFEFIIRPMADRYPGPPGE